jgi:hypothetical protein
MVEVRRATSPSANPVGRSEVWVLRDDSNGGKLLEVTGTCTEYNKPSRLGVHLSAPGAFDGDQAYQVMGVGSRTRFELTGRFNYQGWFYRLLEPFITPAAQRQMELDVGRLKGLVEKG